MISKQIINLNLRVGFCVPVCLLLIPGITNADSEIISKKFNLLSGELESSVVKVSEHRIRIEKQDTGSKSYEIIDTKAMKSHLVNAETGSIYTRNLKSKSSYDDKAVIKLIGEGPRLVNQKYPTAHYTFFAGEVACSHIFISKEKIAGDLQTYLKTFTMVPIKVAGMLVKPEEKLCQRAARDAASQIQKLGVPLLITNKDTNAQNAVFKITNITFDKNYDKKIFKSSKTPKDGNDGDVIIKEADKTNEKKTMDKP